MFHKHRVWSIADAENPADLAEKLTEHTWTLCTGFRLDGYLFLNDATHEDGAQEYGVVKEDGLLQVESLTVSWMTTEKVAECARRAIAGEWDNDEWARPNAIAARQIQAPSEHGRCRLCA